MSSKHTITVRPAYSLALILIVLLSTFFGPAIPRLSAADCQIVLGFAALRDSIARLEGANVVGECLENEYHVASGDGLQRTSGGLLIWRKATNWTGFTNGQDTWVIGPLGLQKRADADRFAWEGQTAGAISAFLARNGGALPQKIETAEVLRQVEMLHAANGGSTFNLYFGNLGGQRLYAVSLYPDRGIVVQGQSIDAHVLYRFILDNRDLLADPRVSVGTWFNTDNGMTYLDVSASLADRRQAIELGKRYNQISIFDLFTFQEINTGGTGESIASLPPATERLPAWGK